MLHLIQRLREIAGILNRHDLVDLMGDEKQLPEALRNELDAHILAKEIELRDLADMQIEISGIVDAIANSYAGGPDPGDADNDQDASGDL